MNNLAGDELFADGALEQDCSLINHFLDQGERKLTAKGDTAYFTFGYFYTDHYLYFCATKGEGTIRSRVGVKPGNPVPLGSNNPTRRLICPCNQI